MIGAGARAAHLRPAEFQGPVHFSGQQTHKKTSEILHEIITQSIKADMASPHVLECLETQAGLNLPAALSFPSVSLSRRGDSAETPWIPTVFPSWGNQDFANLRFHSSTHGCFPPLDVRGGRIFLDVGPRKEKQEPSVCIVVDARMHRCKARMTANKPLE
jgi:hypothetical protein